MGTVTLRLNEEEHKILSILQKLLHEDKSKILKGALWDKFEDLCDCEVIENYEKKANAKKVKFESAGSLIKLLEKKMMRAA